jgi:hypothetical protein
MLPSRIRRISASLATLDGVHLPRAADVRSCHGRYWAEDTSTGLPMTTWSPMTTEAAKAPPHQTAAVL